MRVGDYLRYLRDMSRKIAFRGGFEACLSRPARGGFICLHGSEANYAGLTRETWFMEARKRMLVEEEQGVYVGYGLVQGRVNADGKSRDVCGPLVIVPVEHETDDAGAFDVEYDHEDALLNYDLLALMVPGGGGNQDAANGWRPPTFTRELLDAIGEAEAVVETMMSSGLPAEPQVLVRTIYELLSPHIASLNALPFVAGPTPAPDQLRPGQQSAVTNCQFVFMAVKPSEVTTYQSLTKLIRQTEGEAGADGESNPVLSKLLTSSIEQTHVEVLRDDAVRTMVSTQICPILPLSLSPPQRQAVADAWASEISYVQGPPGTGKSHTITAILLSAVLMGKRVLLVSNKKAALDVVKEKVDSLLGDGALCLAVSDVEGRRKQKAQIDAVIARADSARAPEDFQTVLQHLNEARRRLSILLKEQATEEAAIDTHLEAAMRASASLSELISSRNQHAALHSKDDLRSPALDGWRSVDLALVEKAKELAHEAMAARTSGSAVGLNKALQIRTLLSFATNELGVSWLRDSSRPSSELARLSSMLEAMRKAHDHVRTDRLTHPEIVNLRKSSALKQAELLETCKQALRHQLDLIRLAKGAEAMVALQQFRQVFHFRKPSKLKQIFATCDVGAALGALPIWAAEIKDLSTMFPFKRGLFDLVVVDEASQVNIAELTPAFYRGGRFCVVGDERQLGLGAAGFFALNRNFERLAWERSCAGVSYDTARHRSILVTEHSILDLILRSPYSAQLPQVMLDEHFRSRPTLASFTSSEFYSDRGGLKLMTETARNYGKGAFKLLITGGARRPSSAVVDAEVDKVLEILESIEDGSAFSAGAILAGQSAGKSPSVGVVSFTRDQVIEIRERTSGRFKSLDLIVGTPEELQGNERDIIVLTFALGVGTPYAKAHYENANRFNVATSRARHFTLAVIGEEPKNAERLKRYLNLNDSTEGAFQLAPSRSADGAAEWHALVNDTCARYVAERSARHGGGAFTFHASVSICGQQEVTFVIYNHQKGRGVLLEVDGSPRYSRGQHYPGAQRERLSVLKRAGYVCIHLRSPEAYKHGWPLEGGEAAAFSARIINALDEALI